MYYTKLKIKNKKQHEYIKHTLNRMNREHKRRELASSEISVFESENRKAGQSHQVQAM